MTKKITKTELKEIVKKCELTQGKFAKLMGLTDTAFSKIINENSTREPTIVHSRLITAIELMSDNEILNKYKELINRETNNQN